MLLIALIVGGALRFWNLGAGDVADDELVNQIYATGHAEADFPALMAATGGAPMPLERVTQIRRLEPGRGPGDVIANLAFEEPQSPPLNYLGQMGLMRLFGDTITTARAFVALAGLMTIPAAFWLAREMLPRRPAAAPIAACLVAVSPILCVYARESRYYGLWALLFVVTSATFLRALRRGDWTSWTGFGAASLAALYTFPFHAGILAAQGMFALWVCRLDWRRLWPFLAAAGLASLAYLPWIAAILANIHKRSDWRQVEIPLGGLAEALARLPARAVVDLHGTALSGGRAEALLQLGLLGVIAAAAVWLAWRRDWAPLLFAGLMGGAIWAPLIAADLASGGIRSLIPRYILPAYIMTLMLLAALSADLLAHRARAVRTIAALGLASIACLGLWSGTRLATATTWWNTDDDPHLAARLEALDAAPRPLVVVPLRHQDDGFRAVRLAGQAPPRTRIAFAPPERRAADYAGEGTVFLFASRAIDAGEAETFFGGPARIVDGGAEPMWAAAP